VLRGSLKLSPQNRKARLGNGGYDCLIERISEAQPHHFLIVSKAPFALDFSCLGQREAVCS
jgi:hypothetical protein